MGATGRPDFEQLFRALPTPYMVLDAEMNYVAVNSEYERVTMSREQELLGVNLFDRFPNEGPSGQRLRDSFRHVLETGETDTIAFLHYDIPRPPEQGGGLERRFWTATHIPLKGDDGKVAFIVQNTVDVTEIARLREAANLPFHAEEAQLLERAREAEEQHRALLAESEDFRRLFQQAPGFFAVLWGPDHIFTFANDAYTRLVGGRLVVGLPLEQALPEIRDQGFIGMLDEVYGTGESAGGQAVRVMLAGTGNQPLRETFLDFSYDAIRDRDGTITGVFVQGMDRTEAVRTTERQRLLLDEINHRVKNTLATVQSIAAQTMRSAPDMKTAHASFEARLIALSRAHNLLSAREWHSTDISELVTQELSAHGMERANVEGEALMLRPKALIALALVLHELSTNAAKYGALSNTGGTVSVSWHVEAEREATLVLDWREQGGPPAQPPKRKGFGTRMMERVIAGELGGSIEAGHEPAGFTYRIEIPGSGWATDGRDALPA